MSDGRDLTRQLPAETGGQLPPPLGAGERIGDWRIVEPLASGGFGAVYKVAHAETGHPAALKLLHAHLTTSSETVARFAREIRIVRELEHPSIVRLIDAGFSAGGQPYLSMELLEGEELSKHVARRGPLPVAEALAILEPICEALALAHDRGVVHRDVKSGNVMLCADRVVLVDFGIAKISDALANELTATNQSLGTPSCMAPEQIEGNRADRRTDVYALGALLFHMLTGQMPFQDPSPTMMQYLHLHARRPRASTVTRVPEGFDDVITRAMAIRPDERYPDALAVLAAARAAAQDAPPTGIVATVDTIAFLVSVAERGPVEELEPATFEDLESVLPLVERFLGTLGIPLAADLGSTALFAAPRAQIPDPIATALAVHDHLAQRPGRDPRVQVGLCVHRGDAPFAGAVIQPCPLLHPAGWRVPASLDGVWATSALDRTAGSGPDDGMPARRVR